MWWESVGSTFILLCGLQQSGLHHVAQQSVVSTETPLGTPHWDPVPWTLLPALVLFLLLLDGDHSTPQDVQFAQGGWREGAVDSHPYLQSKSLKVSEQLVLLFLIAEVLSEELLLPHYQLLAHFLELVLLLRNLFVVYLILCEENNQWVSSDLLSLLLWLDVLLVLTCLF